MREEILDELDVVRRHPNEVAGPPARQVGRRQGIEHAEQPEPHVGQQPVRDVVRQPRLEPVQESRDRRDDEERDEPSADRRAPLDGQHREGAHGADADQRRDPRDPQEERGRQAAAVPPAEAEEHRQHARPSEDTASGHDGLGGLRPLRLVRARRRVGEPRLGLDGPVASASLPHLAAHETPVGFPPLEQLRMASALDDASMFEHKDPVGIDDARQAVREDQSRAAGHEPVERRLDDRLAVAIDRRQGLVQDEDRRPAEKGPRDRDALPLPARQPDPTLPDDGLVALREAGDELVGMGLPGRRLELGGGRGRPSHPKVLGDRAVEEIGVLVDHRHERAQVGQRQIPDVAPAHDHAALLRVMEAEQEARHGRLPRAARSDDRHPLTRPGREGQALVRRAAAARIAEGHLFEGDRRGQARNVGDGAGRSGDGRPHRQERQHALCRGKAEHALVEQHAEVPQWAEHLDAQHEDDQQGLEGHDARSDAVHAPAEGDGRAKGDAHVRDAAGQRVRSEHAHRRLEQLAAPRRQERGAHPALAERLQRAQPLERVQELSPERAVGPLAREAPRTVPPVPEGRRQQRHHRRAEQDERDRQVEPRHEGEDQHGRQGRHTQLRQILTEVHLELLHAFDHGQDDVARPRRREVRRAQGEHVRVHPLAQARLDAGRRGVGDHRPGVVESAAEADGERHSRDRSDQGLERHPGQDPPEQPAQETEARDPGGHGQETQEDGRQDAGSHPGREGPELPV